MDIEGVKRQYFSQQIEKGIKDILEAQRMIATKRIYQKGSERRLVKQDGRTLEGRSGLLLYALTYPEYKITFSGEGVSAVTVVPTYIRFLDMKKHGNFMIYNRQIWGILYSETLRNIKYEFRDWIKERFPEMLKQFNNKK